MSNSDAACRRAVRSGDFDTIVLYKKDMYKEGETGPVVVDVVKDRGYAPGEVIGIASPLSRAKAVIYLNPSREIYNWQRAGLCMWCGGDCSGSQCRLRKCESCTQFWIADTVTDVDEGYQITKEYCPPCQVWLDSYHAVNPDRPTHLLCGSVIDPEIKIAGQRWEGWCIWVDANRRDYFVVADTRKAAMEKIIALASKFKPNPLFQDVHRKEEHRVTCKECLPIWNNLHLTHKPALFAAPGDPIIAVGSSSESTAERNSEHVHNYKLVSNSQRTDRLVFVCSRYACDCGDWYNM